MRNPTAKKVADWLELTLSDSVKVTSRHQLHEASEILVISINGASFSLLISEMAVPTPYGAQCPTYPECSGGCGLGCRHEMEIKY